MTVWCQRWRYHDNRLCGKNGRKISCGHVFKAFLDEWFSKAGLWATAGFSTRSIHWEINTHKAQSSKLPLRRIQSVFDQMIQRNRTQYATNEVWKEQRAKKSTILHMWNVSFWQLPREDFFFNFHGLKNEREPLNSTVAF